MEVAYKLRFKIRCGNEITENLRKHVPNDTLKQMLKDGKITKVQYNKNRMK